MHLIDAVIKDIPYIVYFLLKEGSDPNFTEDCAKVTPLHYAVIYNSVHVVPILLLAGADPEARDMFGHTPVVDAIELGRKEIAKIFIKLCK